MDPNGGINPSNPRLDGTTPTPSVASAQPAAAQPAVVAPAQPITPPSIDGIPTVAQPAPAQPQPRAVLPTGFNDMPIGAPQAEPANAEPKASNKKKSSGGFKKVLLIIVAVIFIAAAVGGAYFFGLTTGKTQGKNAATKDYQQKLADLQKEQDSTDTTEDTTTDTAKLDLSNLIDPQYKDETISGEIGKQVSASDGLVLQVTNIERNYKTTDTNYKLDASKELIKVNFLIGNGAKDKPKDISSVNNFRLENSLGAQLTPENIASYPDKLDTVKLEVGAQSKGSIVYAVNKDEKPLKFVRTQIYRINGQNKEVTTKLVITIAS